MPRLHLHLLGPPLVELDGEPVHLERRKALALLAYLALTHRSHSRDSLATLLWPNMDQSRARGRLRRTLSLLNRTLGSGWFAADRETAELAPEAEGWLDVDVLRRCLARCQEHPHPAEDACPDCVPLLAETVDLYRDGFLTGFTLPDSPGFDEWQFLEAEGLRDQMAGALQRLARWHGACGEHEPAVAYARRWLALDLAHEPAHRALMELYARSGQRAAALRQYAECERVLREELGAEPAAETTWLYEQIRDGQIQERGGGGPEAAVRKQEERGGKLPTWLTSFVGRTRELEEIGVRLRDPRCRLLTVAGPGGSGKTRLAVEAAREQAAEFGDGAYFVPLAPVGAQEALAPAIAAAVGLRFHGPADPAQQLASYLRRRQMLLVLDNMEHLTEGGVLVAGLLQNAPGVKALVTSRARLNVEGEHVFPLGGLQHPRRGDGWLQVERLKEYGAVQLFLNSAERVRLGRAWKDEELLQVGEICGLVDGMACDPAGDGVDGSAGARRDRVSRPAGAGHPGGGHA